MLPHSSWKKKNLDEIVLRHTIQNHFIQKNVIQKKKKPEFFWITLRIGLTVDTYIAKVSASDIA